MNEHDRQFQRMTQTPIPKLILSLSIPTIISMLVTAIYNTGDTYFVSKLGTSASGAVGVVFSLMAIIQAVGFAVGTGASSIISRALGAKDNEKATVCASSAVLLAFVLGLLLTVFGKIYIVDLMALLGATPSIRPYAADYAEYILYAAPVMAVSFVLNNILRAEGRAKFAMVGITIGGILNLGLDPLFIFVFNMGIAGAAVATALSQLISCLILLSMFIRGKTISKLNPKRVSKNVGQYLVILKTGMPSLFRQGIASIAIVVLNQGAGVYGDAAVAAMSITMKIFQFIFSVVIGFGQGYQPVLGYNYGAKLYERVRQAFFFLFEVSASVLLIAGIGCIIFAPALMRFFIADDPLVVEIGSKALVFMGIAMPFVALGTVCNMTFQVIGRSLLATLLSAARQGIFFMPLVIILPRFLGLTGIQMAQAGADLLTFFASMPFAISFIREMNRLSAAHREEKPEEEPAQALPNLEDMQLFE